MHNMHNYGRLSANIVDIMILLLNVTVALNVKDKSKKKTQKRIPRKQNALNLTNQNANCAKYE